MNKNDKTETTVEYVPLHLQVLKSEMARIEYNKSFTHIRTRAEFTRVLLDEALSAREAKRAAGEAGQSQ